MVASLVSIRLAQAQS